MIEPEQGRMNTPLSSGCGVQIMLTLLFLILFLFVSLVILPRLGVMAG